MPSMAIDRRNFLLAGGAALLGSRSSARAAAHLSDDELFFTARADGADNHQVVVFDGGVGLLLDCALPARCHAIAVRPDGAQCVAVGRRPGEFALVMDMQRRVVL